MNELEGFYLFVLIFSGLYVLDPLVWCFGFLKGIGWKQPLTGKVVSFHNTLVSSKQEGFIFVCVNFRAFRLVGHVGTATHSVLKSSFQESKLTWPHLPPSSFTHWLNYSSVKTNIRLQSLNILTFTSVRKKWNIQSYYVGFHAVC
jgi:hypothetical protein